jgi:hypothetical protein
LACKKVSEEKSISILNAILHFNYDGREEQIKEIFDYAISKDKFEIFKLLLTTLDSQDVDGYIAGTNSITEAVGGKTLFRDMAGCDALMLSDEPIVI